MGVVSPVDGMEGEGEGAKAVRQDDLQGVELTRLMFFGEQKRQAMLASRSNDPGVIVDVPSLPTAEESRGCEECGGDAYTGYIAVIGGIMKGCEGKKEKRRETRRDCDGSSMASKMWITW